MQDFFFSFWFFFVLLLVACCCKPLPAALVLVFAVVCKRLQTKAQVSFASGLRGWGFEVGLTYGLVGLGAQGLGMLGLGLGAHEGLGAKGPKSFGPQVLRCLMAQGLQGLCV